jgi:hypothetical protein
VPPTTTSHETSVVVVESPTSVAIPATQSPSTLNIALIGGIVGGAVALLLIIGLIAAVICVLLRRSRRRKSAEQAQFGVVLQAARQTLSDNNYARIETMQPPSTYTSTALTNETDYDVGNIPNNK